jgi:proton-dependent oligopeptide transporter, POT family
VRFHVSAEALVFRQLLRAEPFYLNKIRYHYNEPNNLSPSNARWDQSFFGHPRGLSTLFFTEMWERFSYYGMRALLILFMTATVAHGGLEFPTSKAGAIYGLYTAMVFLVSVPGGWIADRITGQRRAVLWGGVVIALGHFSMAVPRLGMFYLGLALIVTGTGLLKPNISTMVGALYRPDDARRDAGFSIFYMGINIGAFIAPLVCGYLGENINWHYGFGAAGVGMTLGLIQYVYGGKYLGTAGIATSGTPADYRLLKRVLVAFIVLIALGGTAAFAGYMSFSAEAVSNAFGVVLFLIVVGLFGWLLNSKEYSPLERRHVWAILVLFLAASLFWSAFEQAGSTLNLFAERNTNLHAWDTGVWGLFRASYYQSINSIFIILLAPVFAWLWVRLGSRHPSSTTKFSWGLLFVGLGFAVLIPVAASTNVSPWWLILTYLLHTIGELCLSPVGLSAMTKLAPARAVGMMMGVWFLADSVGNFIGGRLASVYESFPLPLLFGMVAGFCIALAVVLVFLIRPMRHLSEGVR